MRAISRQTCLSLVFAILASSLLLGCSKDEKGADAAASAVASSSAPQAATPASGDDTANQGEGGLDQKLSAYIECYNRMDESAHRTIGRYRSWVKDMKAGPSGKEAVVYGLYQMDGETITDCKKRFSDAAKMNPKLPLDSAGVEYINSLDELNKVVEEVYPYYDRGNYKDDKFAKGKELHIQLADKMASFQKSSDKFSLAIELENDKRLEAQMNKLEKEQGRKLPFLQMATMHNAKQLIRLVDKDDFAADQASARLDAFEKITDETMQFGKAHADAIPDSWHMFESAAEDYRKAAKERVRRIRDKVAYNEGEQMLLAQPGSGWMVEGSPEKVLKAYNALVDASNRLN